MTKDGSRFIVEMQKAEQAYFKDRSLYYSTFAIREQAPKGQRWDYHLDSVYTVGVLNFEFRDDEYPADKYRHEVKLKDVEDNHVFYDKLTFVYLEMPKFNKSEDELETMFDKWMFVLRNLSRLLDRVFDKLFRQAEIAKYSDAERRQYEASLKEYWDYNSTMDTAFGKGMEKGIKEGMEKGIKEGLEKGKEEANRSTALRMKLRGFSLEDIAAITSLPLDEIEKM